MAHRLFLRNANPHSANALYLTLLVLPARLGLLTYYRVGTRQLLSQPVLY